MNKIYATLADIGINDRISIIKIQYALEVIKNEAIKLIILGLLFFFLGEFRQFIFVIVLLLPLRAFSGGMHMKSNIGCFVYSFIFFTLAIEIMPRIMMPAPTLFFIVAISAITITILAPIASYKRPISTISRKHSLKRKTLVVLSLGLIAIIILWHLNINEYFVIGVWVVALQALQMFITWTYRKRKE